MPHFDNLPTSLLLNGREFSYDALAQYPAHLDAPVNGYEARLLDFVRQWRTGVQEVGLRTSGSTGQPQLVMLQRQQLEASARRTGDFFDLGPGDRALVCLNCEYVGGLMMLVRGLERNMHLTIVEPHADPFAYVRPGEEFDFAAFVPLQLRTVLEAGRASRLNQMRAILVGGATVDTALQQAAQALTVPVWHTYGMTETASHVALRRLNGPEATDYYRMLPGIAVGQDGRGCLTLRGDVTNDKLVITNDVVELLPAQHGFRWRGRADFVINTGGVKVPAEKVGQVLEVALAELGATRACFVAGQPDSRLGEAVTAFVEGPALPPATEKKLLALLAERLEKYEQPRRVVYVPQFRMTATGKIDRLGTVRGVGKTP